VLTLLSGVNSAVVSPENGACVLGWMADRTPILRRALPSAVLGDDVHAMALFPLIPYCNRIAFGRFTWAGSAYQLAPPEQAMHTLLPRETLS
jgi:aldose 1-epimerase